MPAPVIGNVLTPPGFNVISAEGQVVVGWDQTPLATVYYVNRSADGVTFTNIGSTAALQYSDTTGVIGTVYFYQVQAATSLASSLPTVALAALSLNPGQTTVGNLVTMAQRRCDKENAPHISMSEWISNISQSYKELFDILAQKFGDDYFVATPYTYTTSSQQLYPLPANFYKLLLAEVSLNPSDPNSWITLKQFNLAEKNRYANGFSVTNSGVSNIRYRLNGSNLMIAPAPQGNLTLRITFVPRPSQLINLTDLVDGIAGYEEFILANSCILALAKEDSDVTVFAAQRQMQVQRIEEAAANRNIGEPQQVVDVYSNGSWNRGGNGWEN